MKILLLGKGGQVGWELQRALAPLGHVIGLDQDGSVQHPGLCGDFARPSALAETVRLLRPDVIVNAAAHTAVDKAESEPDLARRINATAPGVLAREAAALGAWLVHYSTDYVFDGAGDQARLESDATGPLNVYGQTKLEGEQLIQASGCQHLILRTSWVYGARGANFAKTMLRLAGERNKLSVIDDQIGAPTGADLLADVTAHALRSAQARPEVSGLYHVVAGGETSWHGYARHVIAWAQTHGHALQAVPESVLPIPTSAYPTPAKRPLNSRLSTQRLQSTFNLTLPPWQPGVERMLAEVLG
ncbi:dTDP-4-dehydrorhamnose reductase [Leptothrix ochracea]|uniref:dTDP-4-dehydrorhamnose reductase n=1 Tax=Leptothrix ochracea TaxID=735331 RepID=UPI0034E289CC